MTPRDDRSISELCAQLASARGERLRRMAEELAHDDRAGVHQAVAAALSRDRAHQAELRRLRKLYALEASLYESGHTAIAGVDEVGRGALAGPLSAGACILPQTPKIEGLNDSKALSPKRREELAVQIKDVAICWCVAHVSPAEIDDLGVTAALRRAMGRALAGLELEPDHVIVDGYRMGIAPVETAVVKGDSKVAAISAASILAKVTRDALMIELSEVHPGYDFAVNKGYGTPEHLSALAALGSSTIHRRSFTPGGGTERLF